MAPLVETETSDDAELVAAAREGDRAAFGELYARYARLVHGILLSRVPPSDVDDLVHDVFLNALKRLRSLRDSAAFAGWLAAIARNRAHDYHRSFADSLIPSERVATVSGSLTVGSCDGKSPRVP